MPKLLPRLLAIFVVINSLLTPKLSFAFDAASTYAVNDSQASSGDIVSDTPGKGLIRSDVSYDLHMFGVISDDPVAVYKETNPSPLDRPVLRNGDAVVNVTDYNGKISPGDYITTSPIPGKGMKAEQSGYALGIATSTVTEANKITFQGKTVTVGSVNVALNIQYAELTSARSANHLLDAFAASLYRNVQDPEKFTNVVRYLIGGLVALVAFGLGFFTFSRAIGNGIEAMGRNPLARQSIRASMIMQTALTIITTFGAIILAIIIIRV